MGMSDAPPLPAGAEKAAGRNGSLEQRAELKSLGSHCPVITRRVLVSKIRKPQLPELPPAPRWGFFWPPHLVASWGCWPVSEAIGWICFLEWPVLKLSDTQIVTQHRLSSVWSR
jgi:hypothetical protein